MKEEDVFNTVQEPTPVEQPVAPVQPTETVQPVEQFQTPVEPQPVQQINQDVNFNPMPPKKSPAKTILILLLTAIIIGGATYGGYQYYSSTVENKTKGNDVTETTTTTEETTTTTTTEKKEVKLLDFKTIDDYYLYVNRSGRISGNERIAILSVDNTFYDIKYDLNNRCKKDGDVVKYTIEKSNVEYTCKIDKACYENNNCSLDDPEWTADVTVNEKYKIQKETMTTCVSWANYTNGKYHLNFLHGCGQGGYYVKIESENNKVLFDGKYEYNVILPGDHSDDPRNSYKNAPLITKDDVVYFIVADKAEDYTNTTCRLKYINLNEEQPSVKDMNVTTECKYATGE